MPKQENENQTGHSRVLKFRAWDRKNKRWVYFQMVKGGFTVEIAWEFEDIEGWQQFTGLKSKSGVDIYEGDILRKYEDCEQCDNKFLDGKVVWKYYGWYLEKITPNTNHEIYDHIGMIFSWDEREIIGNIYENPELLK